MGLEETHHRSHEVPCEIDGSKEDDSTYGNLIGEQHLDVIHQASLLRRILLSCKLRTFLKLALQVPGNKGHHKQSKEHDT